MKKGVVIAGPTGVGKTDLSIKLAKNLNSEIISADSAQIYRGMDIGTAKIEADEMQGVVHHMIDILEPTRKYSVGEFQKDVDRILKNMDGEKTPLLVGGTGLYIDSITKGLANLPKGDEKLREELMKKDVAELFKELEKVDVESSKNIHPNNKKRVVRALEVYRLTGKKFSKLTYENIKGNDFDFLKIALERGRENLYERINRRVDIMIEQGLESEVRELYTKYGEILRSINIIGYSEFIDYFKGILNYEQCIEKIKQNSRRYAKRQFTWLKNDHSYIWYNLDDISEDKIIEDVLKLLER